MSASSKKQYVIINGYPEQQTCSLHLSFLCMRVHAQMVQEKFRHPNQLTLELSMTPNEVINVPHLM